MSEQYNKLSIVHLLVHCTKKYMYISNEIQFIVRNMKYPDRQT